MPFHPYYTMKDGFGIGGVPDRLCRSSCSSRPNYLGHPDNYIPANPLVTPDAHRAGMVLPAVLRDPARRSRQAGRRDRHVRRHRRAVPPALARHVAGPLRHVPADLQVVRVRAGDRRHRAGRLRRPSAGRLVRPAVPARHASTTSSTSSSCCRSWARSNGRCHCRPASPMRCSRRRVKHHAQVSSFRQPSRSPLGRRRRARRQRGGPVRLRERIQLPDKHWHFQGPFGTYDRAAAQRGFQVYKEVCSACHSLSLLSYRNLTELGLTEDQVKDLIKDIQVPDLNDEGATVDRPAARRTTSRSRSPTSSPPPPPTTARRRPTSASSSRRARAGRTMSMES